MNPLSAVLNFAGSLLPVVFPEKEFKPKRLAAVLLILAASYFMVTNIGVEQSKQVVEVAEDVMELTEQPAQ